MLTPLCQICTTTYDNRQKIQQCSKRCKILNIRYTQPSPFGKGLDIFAAPRFLRKNRDTQFCSQINDLSKIGGGGGN